MNKMIKHSYMNAMNQDISKSKLPNEFYYRGQNIRIVATNSQSTGSVTNEKGNSLIITIPIPSINGNDLTIEYNDKALPYNTTEIDDEYLIISDNYKQSGIQTLIGHGIVRNNFILFTTDNNGFDCIWKMNYDTHDLTLLYLRNLGFSINNPIDVPVVFPSNIPDKILTLSASRRCEVKREVPGRRRPGRAGLAGRCLPNGH